MRKGFSLVEVLVTSILMAIVLTGVSMVIIISMGLSKEIYAQSSASNDMNFIRSVLMQDVREASKVIVPADGKTLMVKKSTNGVLNETAKYEVFKDSDDKYQLRRAVKSGGSWGAWQIITKQSEVILVTGEQPFKTTATDGNIVLSTNIKTKTDCEPKAYSAVLNTYIACKNR